MIKNKNFFDELDQDWGDVLTDIYTNAHGVKVRYTNDKGRKIIKYGEHNNDLSLKGNLILDDDTKIIGEDAFVYCKNLVWELNNT